MRDQDQAKVQPSANERMTVTGAGYRPHPSWVWAITGLAVFGPGVVALALLATWPVGLRAVEPGVLAISRAVANAMRCPPLANQTKGPVMKKKYKKKGKTHVSVHREMTILHLDPTTEIHAAHHAAALAARLKAQANQAEKIDYDVFKHLKYPSLGDGLMFGADGRELSSDEHKRLLTEVAEARAYYTSEGTRKNGRTRLRERPTTPLHSMAVLMRPDHAAGLAALDQSPKFRHLVRPFVKQCLQVSGVEFEAATGLEVVAQEVHPREGMLHFHITYASVSDRHELLWKRGHRGRHGLRLLGPSHAGTLRLVAAGFLSPVEGSLALHDFKDRCRELGGELPVDWRLGLVVEGMVEAFAEKHGLQGVFCDAAERYRAELDARRAERPAALKAAKKKAEAERDQLRNEVAALKAQLAQTNKHAPAFFPTLSQPAALPPLPSISLQHDVRQQRERSR